MKVAAYIMFKVFMGHIPEVIDALRQLDAVTSVTVTTGEYDVIARVDLSDLEALYDLTVNYIGKIKGTESVTTAIVEKEF